MKNRNELKLDKVWQQLGVLKYNSYYWEYQYLLGKKYIVPFLLSKSMLKEDFNVCEIGSAEGGVLFAFAEIGANFCLGTDIAENRLEAGYKIAKYFNKEIKFLRHNILSEEIPSDLFNKFDIVILRDVIEHLDDPGQALKQISKLLSNNGVVYVTFPPYPSPFGGHQHLLGNFWGLFPFVHWLPYSLFVLIVKNGRKIDVEEVLRLKRNNFTLNKFYFAVEQSNFNIFYQNFYLIRPVYKIKFGLTTLPIPKFIKSNLLRNVFSTEAEFILKKT